MVDDQFARSFVERYVDAWNSHDAEQIEPLVAPDVVWLDPALPEPARGVEEVKDFMRRSWVRSPTSASARARCGSSRTGTRSPGPGGCRAPTAA